MATVASLSARKDAIVAQYRDNAGLVRDVQRQAIADLLPALRDELDLDEEAVGAGKAFLQDRVTVFRFCRRARFSPTSALKLLHATLHWRFTSSLRNLTAASIAPTYRTHPLFFFHPALADRFGRPCAVLNLRHVQRTDDGSLDSLKDFIRVCWEAGRRYLSDLSRQAGEQDDPKLQMVLIVDLEGAGMSNLEVELLPFFMDLLKSHFPGMVGGVFLLNYGWAYAGMWQLAKRVLPKTALERIMFPTEDELLEFFEEDHLLVAHGGTVDYKYSPANPILEKYGQALLPPSRPSSAYPSPHPSRSPSSTSLSTAMYHSAPNSRPTTPTLSRRPSGLVMTPAKPAGEASSAGWPWNWVRGGRAEPESGGGLRRVRSFAELQQRLEQTQREIDSDDSILDSASEHEDEASEATQPDRFDPESPGGSSLAPSGRSSRFSSRAASRVPSREVSPMRRRTLEPLRMTTEDDEETSRPPLHLMSPYNASNPHFGYPAYVPTSSFDPSGIPRPHHLRRRKRDLLRTLTYLAALRFLALHRALRYRLSLLVATLFRLTGLSWWQTRRLRARLKAEAAAAKSSTALTGGALKDVQDRKVHFATQIAALSPSSASSSANSSSSSLSSIIPPQPHTQHPPRLLPSALPYSTSPPPPPPVLDLDPTVVYLALLFLVVRTPHRRDKLKRLVRFLAVGAPVWSAKKARELALYALLGSEKAQKLRAWERAGNA
ncbi:hypothetical protein JCM10207_004656 [Rhodosporidiobolus poonsookiae]